MAPIRKHELESTQIRRRKRSINTFPPPIEHIFPAIKHPSRSVYIVTRPLTKAGNFKFLSEGKLPLCHWGLLVSKFNPNELREQIISQSESNSCAARTSWGTLYEIINGGGVMVLNRNEYFGRCFGRDWTYAIIAHVGKTHLPDSTIYDHGNIIDITDLTLGSV